MIQCNTWPLVGRKRRINSYYLSNRLSRKNKNINKNIRRKSLKNILSSLSIPLSILLDSYLLLFSINFFQFSTQSYILDTFWSPSWKSAYLGLFLQAQSSLGLYWTSKMAIFLSEIVFVSFKLLNMSYYFIFRSD